ncbi:MAG: DUF4443 domain-containing protein [Candidatus Odinarchaeia archaeon]
MTTETNMDDLLNLLELIVINESESIGRYTLKNALGISEGKTRSRLKNLFKEGLIIESPRGAKLSVKGKTLLKDKLKKLNIKKYIFYDKPLFGIDKLHYLFHLSVNGFKRRIPILELRDEAIRGGALSAIIIALNGESLTIPEVYDDICKIDKKSSIFIKNNFKIKNADLLIITSADERWDALRGGLKTILKINKDYLE